MKNKINKITLAIIMMLHISDTQCVIAPLLLKLSGRLKKNIPEQKKGKGQMPPILFGKHEIVLLAAFGTIVYTACKTINWIKKRICS